MSFDAFFFSLRDTRTAAKMLDHIADMNDELCPFPKVALRHLCSQMGVENDNPLDGVHQVLPLPRDPLQDPLIARSAR